MGYLSSRGGTPCAHVYPHPGLGRGGFCGRFVSKERAAAGARLCSVHDPRVKETTRAAHLARQSRERVGVPSPERAFREATIAAIKAVYVWWDEPGSPGREG